MFKNLLSKHIPLFFGTDNFKLEFDVSQILINKQAYKVTLM